MPSKKKTVDVRSPKDHKALLDTIAAHPMTIILIHADYCGHCQTYKEDIWKPLEAKEPKKNGMAAIHYDQLEGTPFADAKIQGYPSVILVGKKKLAEFEDEEGKTNAMPSDQARDMDLMTELVTSAEPSTLIGKVKGMSSNVDVGEPAEPASEPATEPATEPEPEESPVLDATAKAMRNENSIKKKSEILSSGKKAKRQNSVEVPDPGADRLNSQLPASGMNFEPPATAKEPKVGGGGSLYASLLAAARDVGPAVALTAAAVALNKKTRRGKGRKGRKSRKARKSKAQN